MNTCGRSTCVGILLLVLCTYAEGFRAGTGTVHHVGSLRLLRAPAQLRLQWPRSHHDQSSTVPCRMGLLDDMGGFFKRFTQRAKASHILIKGGAEAEHKLQDLTLEIDNSPVKFAEAAARYSACPSGRSGGDLGEFGPGAMVREFDQVVFNEPVGVVHGPIKTQFGYHLIYIRERTE